MNRIILLRGGGDLASGVALRLHRAGFGILITETAEPLSVRRLVSFSEAVFDGETQVEGITATLIKPEPGALLQTIQAQFGAGNIPIMVDPSLTRIGRLAIDTLIDARMTKRPRVRAWDQNTLTVGLGPGFSPGENCHVAVETKRGHNLGRVFWEGSVAENTGEPDAVMGITHDRVIRAPASGLLNGACEIGNQVSAGDVLGSVAGHEFQANFDGILRGMLRDGAAVTAGLKIGDLDPRGVREYCTTVSDKALAVGGGVLEALLTWDAKRK